MQTIYHNYYNQDCIIIAKVDIKIEPDETILWEYEFPIASIPDTSGYYSYTLEWYDNNNDISSSNYGNLSLSSGTWTFTPITGTINSTDQKVEIKNNYNQELIGTLTSLNQIITIDVPIGNELVLSIEKPTFPRLALAVIAQRTTLFATNGYEPNITPSYNQLFIKFLKYEPPRIGQLITRAKIYNSSNLCIGTSNDIVLNISANAINSGGS